MQEREKRPQLLIQKETVCLCRFIQTVKSLFATLHLTRDTMKKGIVINLRSFGCYLLISWMTISATLAHDVSPEHAKIHEALTYGVKTINKGSLSPVIPTGDDLYPILCGGPEAYTGNPMYLQGSCPPIVLAGHRGKGRIVAFGHDGWLLGNPDDSDASRLALNSLLWLAEEKQPAHIAFYTSLGNFINTKTLSASIKEELTKRDIALSNITVPVSKTDLSRYTTLVIARPHTRLMDEEEAEVISRFVENGGGILMAGLGWFWAKHNPTLPITDFPLNALGSRLGIEFLGDIVYHQSETGQRCPAMFQIEEPKAWNPKTTRIFQYGETSDQDICSYIRQHMNSKNYAIEGEHVILNLPAYGFLGFTSPNKAIKDLDLIYKTHAHLASNIPYNGNKISLVVVNRLCFHLCSGNPILIRRDRIPVILKDFNRLGHPGWGLIHELGHDFVASAHNHAYQLGPGDNESWANIFTTHAYDILNLKYDKHWLVPQNQQKGIVYYFTTQSDYNLLKTDPWIMLGLLTVIKEAYGWKPFYKFFQRCSSLTKTRETPKSEQEKVDFLVQELSIATGVNLSPYFVRWGFPVSDSVVYKLNNLPKAKLDNVARSIASRFNVSIN